MEYPEQKANPLEIENALYALDRAGLYFGSSFDTSHSELSSEELSYFKSISSPKRASQFAAGRNAARAALKKYTVNEQPQSWVLTKLENGLVSWPQHLVGSISHCQEAAIAVTAEKSKFQGVGIDLEFYREVNAGTIARIADVEELEILTTLNRNPKANFFAIFSAKESIFKAIFPLINHKFGFSVVRLADYNPVLSQSQNQTTLELNFRIVEDLSSEFCSGSVVTVRLYQTDSFALTLCALPGIL